MIHAVRLPHPEPKARMIWLHGLGSHEGDLLEAARYLSAPVEHVALRAPYAYFGGFAWFDIDFSTMPPTPDLDQAQESRDLLVDWVRQVPEDLPLLMGGFSQGAMMTLGSLSPLGEKLKGAVLLSGAPVPGSSAPSGLPVFLAHGDEDDVLPVAGADEIFATLTSQGAVVESYRYSIGHGVSEETLADLDDWLHRLTGAGS